MKDVIPNGTQVLIFNDLKKGESESLGDLDYVKGTVVSSLDCENNLYEIVYNVIDETGRSYLATYGSSAIGPFFIRTGADYTNYIRARLMYNNDKISCLNRENEVLNKILENLSNDIINKHEDKKIVKSLNKK